MPNIKMCDPKGADETTVIRNWLSKITTSYIDPELTHVYVMPFPTSLTTLQIHNLVYASGTFGALGISALALPKLTDLWQSGAFKGMSNLTTLDLAVTRFAQSYVANDSALTTIILRHTSVVTLNNVNAFTGTPFADGGTGGTIYIPKALYDHLGDGTANDYEAASNWSTVNGYGTITWAKIEGSTYETHYGDGTLIPT